MPFINQFVEDDPAISVRQVTRKLADITTHSHPRCISKSGRNWEEYADHDERLWGTGNSQWSSLDFESNVGKDAAPDQSMSSISKKS
jgi:hypothetical protein